MRNACAFAKLLLKKEVDAECAMLSVRLLTEGLASFNAKTTTVLRKATNKGGIARNILSSLNDINKKGWSIDVAAAQLAAYSRYWQSESAAREWLLTRFQATLIQVSEGRYRWTGEGIE